MCSIVGRDPGLLHVLFFVSDGSTVSQRSSRHVFPDFHIPSVLLLHGLAQGSHPGTTEVITLDACYVTLSITIQ